jgi:ribosomal protein S18 acetylase RimI-like enzyme
VEIRELDKVDIPKAIEISLAIFSPKNSKNSPYYDPQKWNDYLDNGGILLGAFVNNKLVGYLMSYRKTSRRFHVWMAGVKKEFRRRGVMTRLLKTLERKLVVQGYELMTINVCEVKSPEMFAFVKKKGFEVKRTKIVDWDGEMVVKSFFEKKLTA